MIKQPRRERRQYPRVEQRLPLKISANGYDFSTITQNVSCVGAYCRVNKYIPPFTKIAVKITLPVVNNKNDCNVECKGVVVRTQDGVRGGFNIAIFFNELKDYQRQKISQYINQFLPK